MVASRTGITLSVLVLLAACGESAPTSLAAPDVRLESDGGCIDLAPGVRVEQADDQPDPAKSLPVRFVVTFDVPVTGFDGDDLILGGKAGDGATATVTPREGDAAVYDVAVSNVRRAGAVTVSVRSAAAVAPGLCNNLTAASTSIDNEVRFNGSRHREP